MFIVRLRFIVQLEENLKIPHSLNCIPTMERAKKLSHTPTLVGCHFGSSHRTNNKKLSAKYAIQRIVPVARDPPVYH